MAKKKAKATTKATKKPAAKKAVTKLTARTADKHALYESSVQDTSADIQFLSRVYKKERGRVALSLREDFCGTGNLCAAWAASHPERTAVGLDLHQPTMDWGKRRHLTPLGEAAERVQLLKRNVLDGAPERVDLGVAFNFSYCIFKSRAEMKRYLAAAFAGTADKGAFVMDIHGGTESFEEMDEHTRHRGFTYVWDQEPYDAINGFAKRHIHFRFGDGTEMKRAFTYDWRLWNLPELRDLLEEVGFSHVDVYWEGADDKGGGNGIFRKASRAENEASWIAYIVAWR